MPGPTNRQRLRGSCSSSRVFATELSCPRVPCVTRFAEETGALVGGPARWPEGRRSAARENTWPRQRHVAILDRVFLTISTAAAAGHPASDLGYLLHKHPDRIQEFAVSAGTAHVFYPEAGEDRCTAVLLLETDPAALARGRGRQEAAAHVTDRPYVASSLLAVALGQVFRSAMRGECAARPALAATELPLRIEVPALSARGGAAAAHRLFTPLGWRVTAEPVPLDPQFPAWGDASCVRLVLAGTTLLSHALRQLYVLLPVLDDGKHYWITEEEVDKLLRAGEGWLASHPEQRFIAGRYLAHRTAFTRRALQRLELARLAESDDTAPEELDNAVADDGSSDGGDGSAPQAPGGEAVPLAERRRKAVLAVLRECRAARVADLGCGSGQLLAELLKDPGFTDVLGMDVSVRALRAAERRLGTGRMPERQRARLTLVQGSLMYTDARLAAYDAAVLSEVIEHVDPPRLPALEHAVFAAARPRVVVVTTPNAEYNARYPGLPAGAMRHEDHRFEWPRKRFRAWAGAVAAAHGYTVAFRPVGDEDPELGPPTQLALFTRTTDGTREGRAA
jgi:3' terminal RNA ribose 2'-O-methyltransferase Hen1